MRKLPDINPKGAAHTRKKKETLEEWIAALPVEQIILEFPEDQRTCSKCIGNLRMICKKSIRREMVRIFEYQLDRKGDRIKAFLRSFSGCLATDGYAEYNYVENLIPDEWAEIFLRPI